MKQQKKAKQKSHNDRVYLSAYFYNNYFLKKDLKKGTILHFLKTVFNVWLNRGQLDFHICFCIQFIY